MVNKFVIIASCLILPFVCEGKEYSFGQRKDNDTLLFNVTRRLQMYSDGIETTDDLYEVVQQYNPPNTSLKVEPPLKINFIQIIETNALFANITGGGLGDEKVNVTLWSNQRVLHYVLQVFGHPSSSCKSSPSTVLYLTSIAIVLWKVLGAK